jgi:hypothetical protein
MSPRQFSKIIFFYYGIFHRGANAKIKQVASTPEVFYKPNLEV